MKLGVIYPQVELGGDPVALRRFAQAAEELGYEHLVMYDHLLGASHEDRDPPLWGPYTEHDPFHDPLVSFAYLSACTERLQFVTGILILPARQTLLVARQVADVELVSGGRLRLGVGTGYNPVEFEAMGVDFGARGRKMDEQLPYLRRLWTEELVSHEGEFERIDRAALNPRPATRVPIWFGGFAERAFRRAVALGDGFIFGYGLSADAAAAWERVQTLLIAAGRPMDEFGAHFLMHPPQAPYSDDETIAGLEALRAQGATHASLYTLDRGFRSVDEHIDYLAAIQDRAGAVLA
jgi:probable F420-dependent oxidoreductase